MRYNIEKLKAAPAIVIAFAGLLTLVWMGFLIWIPLRLLQLI
jgi:hypothetical protein